MSVETALIRDVVVVVPGIMGSELVDRAGRPVWTVSPGGLVRSIRALAGGALTLPAGIGDEAPDDGIRPTRLLNSLHVIPGLWSPITGYDGLIGFLNSPRFHLIEPEPGTDGLMPNLIQFPYDWRLSNRHNGRRLARVALKALDQWRQQPGMHDAKLVLLCHSMGGLVARWFAEKEGGSEYIRALITIGTPHRGSLKALSAIVNGLEPWLGLLQESLSALARSLPSLYQLLPQYACLIDGDRRVGLAGGACPRLDATMLADADAFHVAINHERTLPYALHKVVGIRQPTATTARLVEGRVEPLDSIDGKLQGGDGTVPRLAAEPVAGRGQEVHEVAGQHGELQGTRSLLDLVDGILLREQIVWQSDAAQGLGVAMDDVWCTVDSPSLQVHEMGDHRLRLTLLDEGGRTVDDPRPVPPDGRMTLAPLPEGGYRAIVQGGAGAPAPVSKPFVVLAAG